MRGGEQGEGRGPKDRERKNRGKSEIHPKNLEQIEYLLFQSTQGIHFIFENSDIARILSQPSTDQNFSSAENMKKVQGLLSAFINCACLDEKRSFLERLPVGEFELLIRAYFQLVENTILAHSNLRH